MMDTNEDNLVDRLERLYQQHVYSSITVDYGDAIDRWFTYTIMDDLQDLKRRVGW